ncbi:uncharacterized protein LOC134213966 [Armigeres subalbatus]|uniref:uncharacterized protein LOC134213966 n=1 Tax=Armigeres subalbatus TaxID=124917 RepID=UPI002ECFED2E
MGRSRRNDWFDEECRQILEEKDAARAVALQQGVVFQPKTAEWNPPLKSGATVRFKIRQQTTGAIFVVATQPDGATNTISHCGGSNALALPYPAAQPLPAPHKLPIHWHTLK